MKNLHINAVQQKRQYLINELIRYGIYKKNNKHLYEWTLIELETEYQYIETNGLDSSPKTTRLGSPSVNRARSNVYMHIDQ